jgi:hypothetical protein
VNLAMMSTAEWDGEFVADLAPERAKLGKANVMRIGGFGPHVSDEARIKM